MRRRVADLRDPWWQKLIPVGAPIAIPPQPLFDLQTSLGRLFGHRVGTVIDVRPLTVGQHSSHHLAVSTTGGRIFGVKATPSESITRAVQFAKIASLLHAPGACPAVRCPTLAGLPNVGNADLLITEWVPAGVSFGHLVQIGRHKDLLRARLHRFAHQYGSATHFGLSFGVTDRGSTNWVWDVFSHRLAIVDTEYAFNPNAPASDYHVLLKDGQYYDVFNSLKDDDDCRERFRLGVERMRQAYLSHRADVTAVLNAETLTTGYSSQWLARSAQDFVDQVIMTM